MKSIPNIRKALIACVLLIAISGVYFQAGSFDFVAFDDDIYVFNNPVVCQGVSWEGILWAFDFSHSLAATYWHPVTWISHMVDYEIFSLNPGAHHLINVAFHYASSVLLFLILIRITRAPWKSAFVAMLFAVHPLNVESVAWVAERKSVLSTFLWMLTTLAYLRYTRKQSFFSYLVILILFAIGLMSKPALVTLPFVFILLDFWPLRRLNSLGLNNKNGNSSHLKALDARAFPALKKLLSEKTPLFLMSIASVAVSSLSLQGKGNLIGTETISMGQRIGHGLVSYGMYLGKIIWPTDMAIFYPPPETTPILHSVCAAILLAFITILTVALRNKRPYLLFGWLWYCITLTPMIGLMRAGLWPSMADRFTYIPSIGIFIMLTWLIADLLASMKMTRSFVVFLGIAVTISLAGVSYFQVRHWQGTRPLFEHALRVTENNYLAHFKLFMLEKSEGKNEKATWHYNKALTLNPTFVAMGHNVLGYKFAIKGKLEEAKIQFLKAVEILPAYAETRSNLGVVLARMGDYKNAVFHLKKAVQLDPGFKKAKMNFDNILKQKPDLK